MQCLANINVAATVIANLTNIIPSLANDCARLPSACENQKQITVGCVDTSLFAISSLIWTPPEAITFACCAMTPSCRSLTVNVKLVEGVSRHLSTSLLAHRLAHGRHRHAHSVRIPHWQTRHSLGYKVLRINEARRNICGWSDHHRRSSHHSYRCSHWRHWGHWSRHSTHHSSVRIHRRTRRKNKLFFSGKVRCGRCGVKRQGVTPRRAFWWVL